MPNIKPILFNTDMTRAILDDRKTVTRRVVKLKYSNTHLEMFTNKYGTRLVEKQNEEPGITTVKNPDGTTTHKVLACIEKTPPYRPGDILYVRETWQNGFGGTYLYKASAGCDLFMTPDGELVSDIPWRPSIHMPREAARIFLRVTDVRVERLQSIRWSGIVLEGVLTPPSKWFSHEEALARMKEVWDSTIKPADLALYGWDANPWVWVIAFERISKEEALNG